MQLRPLGNTGLEISPIVFGAGAVGGGVFRGEESQRLETVRRARDHGINWVDTAPSYGDGQSEENLGWILRELDWNPNLSTKVRLSAEEMDDIPHAVRNSIEESLKRIGRDAVQLIQLTTRFCPNATRPEVLSVSMACSLSAASLTPSMIYARPGSPGSRGSPPSAMPTCSTSSSRAAGSRRSRRITTF